MAHISSIGAGMFSDFSVHMGTALANTDPTSLTLPGTPESLTSWDDFFSTSPAETNGAVLKTTALLGTDFIQIKNIREFPSMGTPPNIVNVPTYGQRTSSQIQGQSDAPNMELTINYIPAMWASTTRLGAAVGKGNVMYFRFSLLNEDPGSARGSMGANKYTVANTQYFFIGKIEALLVNPQLTDANTATLTISVQSNFYGAFTTD